MERTKKPEFGNIGSGDKGIITLEDVKNNFKEYNFIIKFNDITVDTSRFFGCGFATNFTNGSNFQPAGVQSMLSNLKVLCLYSLKDGVHQEGNEDDIKELIFLPELDKHNVPYNYDITVKSKRNFLLNQKTTKL